MYIYLFFISPWKGGYVDLLEKKRKCMGEEVEKRGKRENFYIKYNFLERGGAKLSFLGQIFTLGGVHFFFFSS